MSPESLSRLGRYELIEVLGRGAMGVVYKAHDSFLDRTVAVKTYRQDVALSENVRRRFEREVRTASKLVHPNVVTVYDGGLEGDIPFLAMEFVEGTTLEAELERRGKLSVPEALALVFQVVEGLAYAHEKGIIHRDLKPANILLSKNGQVKIADFGVAKLMTADTGATINPVGTPSYMSPEQVSGKPVDVRADVFALGILAYQLLTGEKPFAGDTWTAVLFQILNSDPKRPTEARPELPRGVDEVLRHAMHKDVAQRTPDVATFGRELRGAFESAAAPPAGKIAERAAPIVLDADEPRIATRGDYRIEEEPHLTFDPGDLEAFGLARGKPEPSRPPVLLLGVIVGILLLVGIGVAVLVWSARRPAGEIAAPEPTVSVAEETARTPLVAPARPAPTAAPTAVPTARPTPKPKPSPKPTATVPPQPTPAPPPPTAPPPPPTAPPPPPPPVRVEPPVAPVVVPPPPLAPPPVVPPEPQRELASMDVISTPPRAQVFVDGQPRGTTPLRIADLRPGHYEFDVRMDGYVAYKRSVDLEGQARYEMKVTLVPEVNSLRVVSEPPGADVTLNGEPKGRTPVLVSGLPSGTYEVVVSPAQGEPQRERIELKTGELRELRFTLPRPE